MAGQKQSGLDIDLGNLCSKDAFEWAKKTFPNRSNKAGAIALDVEGVFSNMLIFGNQRIGIGSDGIGTKKRPTRSWFLRARSVVSPLGPVKGHMVVC